MEWFRMYWEFAFDPKITMLSEVDQRRYIILLCLMRKDGITHYNFGQIAKVCGISPTKLEKTLKKLEKVNLIRISDTEILEIVGWDKRQMKSDTSNERVKKHRASCNVTETLQKRYCNGLDSDTDSEKIQRRENLESSLRSDSCSEPEKTVSKPKKKSTKGTFDFETGKFGDLEPGLIEIWKSAFPALNIEQEMIKAAAWLIANPKNRKSDYKRFLNNWLCKGQDSARSSPGTKGLQNEETDDEWLKRITEEKCNEEERKREQRENERKDIENKGMF